MMESAPELAPQPADILFVDDEPDARAGVCQLLTTWGHRAQAVASGREALSCLKQRKIDLVIMDIRMPRMDGLESSALIRVTHPFVPIVLLTGAPYDVSPSAMRELHIEGVFQKPLQKSLFEATLNRLQSRMAATGKIVLPVV
ncbi:MAG TPA: response regulator [bacterium]|nr:response regulator [bacterium]